MPVLPYANEWLSANNGTELLNHHLLYRPSSNQNMYPDHSELPPNPCLIFLVSMLLKIC